MRRKAFTLVEMMVAMGLLAIVMVMAGSIFRMAIGSYRMAKANGEVLQKLRVITSQLDRDLQGLRKEGEIFILWDARSDSNVPDTEAGYARFDRIMFFATGDFQSLEYNDNSPLIRGNLARISYSLAKRYDPQTQGYRDPNMWPPRRRILARTQHLLVSKPDTEDKTYIDPNRLASTDPKWFQWHNRQQYDATTLSGWRQMSDQAHVDALSVIEDFEKMGSLTSGVSPKQRGTQIDPCDPNALHMLLSEGVGQFAVQGWYAGAGRWVPALDINGDGQLEIDSGDSDFNLKSEAGKIQVDTADTLGLLYTGDEGGGLVLGGNLKDAYQGPFDPDHFAQIPGLGRALKFTFTLYDSKGVLKRGRTFTHIVDLDH